MDACTNPEILKVIWFFLIIIDIVKIIIPIALIVLGIIDFSKAVITSDENIQKKSGKLLVKRFIYAILVFITPWIVKILIITLGDLAVLNSDEVNFTDCLDNANAECIEVLESGNQKNIEKYCDVSSDYFAEQGLYCWQCKTDKKLYKWGRTTSVDHAKCPAGWDATNYTQENCGVKKCFQCTSTGAKYWGVNTVFANSNCPTSWVPTNYTEENCK